jgi:hypothetical protein
MGRYLIMRDLGSVYKNRMLCRIVDRTSGIRQKASPVILLGDSTKCDHLNSRHNLNIDSIVSYHISHW